MKLYFKIIGVFLLIDFFVGTIVLLFKSVFITEQIGLLFIFIFITYILAGPAIGLLFYYIGSNKTVEDIKTEKQEKRLVLKNDIFEKIADVSSDVNVKRIINENSSVFERCDKIEKLFKKGEINRETYDDAIYRIKSRGSQD